MNHCHGQKRPPKKHRSHRRLTPYHHYHYHCYQPQEEYQKKQKQEEEEQQQHQHQHDVADGFVSK